MCYGLLEQFPVEQHEPPGTWFHGIFDMKMASPHQPVVPAKTRPAPKNALRKIQFGSTSRDSVTPVRTPMPMVIWTCCMSGKTFFADLPTGNPVCFQAKMPCLRAAFTASTHHDQWAVAGDFRRALFELAQGDELSAGDVFLGVLDRFTDIDKAATACKQVFEVGW